MFTQKTQSSALEASKTSPRHSRKLVAIIASTALVVTLAAIGVYFVAFRSLPTTVSWAPSVSAMASGDNLTVSGQIRPVGSGRQVLVQSAPTARGPWVRVSPTVTTDGRGRFAITFKPQLTGSIVMRVAVDPAGRYLDVIGLPKPVRLLTLSSIGLKGGGLVTNQVPVNFAVAVDPPSVGRTVRLEQSSDKVHWVPLGASAQTQGEGKAVIRVPGLAVGVWSYRATVAQDNKFAAAVSPLAGATVEDIKVVAARAAAAHAKAVAELARQEKASADRQAAAHAEADIFVGIWNSHGGQLVVNADGSATLEYRMYVWCSDNPTPPCDQMNGNLIISGGHVNMQIVKVITANGMPKATAIVDTSSDPKIPSGSQQNFELNGGVITWTDRGQPFCDTQASQASACGA
jgi:archaellum component FlaG (FlaF/FlaG flagellin family)